MIYLIRFSHSLRVWADSRLLGSALSGASPDCALLVGFIGRKKASSLSLVASLLAALRTDKLATFFLPSKVKSYLVPELAALYNDLNFDKLRIARPSKFIFLCGGAIRSDDSTKADSLRDYLYRVRLLGRRLRGGIVLAEAATQLYRDTHYGDLISFEEDIARVAAVVLVIAESPGSLAELGAFASNDVIRKALKIIMQQKYSTAESFIRFGPVERMKKEGDGFVGFYPWRTTNSGGVVLRSVRPHHDEIVRFIAEHLDAAPKTEQFPKDENVRLFYVIYWVIYLSMAVSVGSLYTAVQTLERDRVILNR